LTACFAALVERSRLRSFNALVEDLTKSLNKFKVGKAEQNQLLGVLGPMRPQIVEKK
jgi:hemoglobin